MQYFTGSFFHQYPFLEYRGFRFTDNDTFRNRQSEVDRQAAAEPKVNILNGFPGDNELAVGTKKNAFHPVGRPRHPECGLPDAACRRKYKQ